MIEVFIFLLVIAFIYAFIFGMVYILDSMVTSGVVTFSDKFKPRVNGAHIV